MTHILILDDCSDLLALMQSIFSVKGYKATTCLTTADFFNQLEKELPDLVVIDLKLSDGDGRDICIQVKENPATKHIPVLLISGNPDKLREHSTHIADAILDKPFDLKELNQVVNNLLAAKVPQTLTSNTNPKAGYWWENESYY